MTVATHAGDLRAPRRAVHAEQHNSAANGLRTAHIPRPLEWGPDRPQPGKREDDAFDIEAENFVALARVLRG